VRTKIQKWGNSLGLRIPRSLAEEAGLVAGSEVDLTMRRGELVVKPARHTKYRLEDLLRQITSKNMHDEVDAGAPVGREAW
jgi:antitoxin MazE